MSHAKLAPSASKRWLTCPGSVNLIARLTAEGKIPEEEESSVFAEEGTAAHETAATLLRGGHAVGGDLEALSHVQTYVRMVQEVAGANPVAVELTVPLFYSPQETGTVDAAVLVGTTLHVFDLKFGRGVLVEAEENSQLRIYAMSYIRSVCDALEMDVTDVHLHIVQPRYREGANFSDEKLTRAELEDWALSVTDVASAIERGIGELVASQEGCRWCAAAAFCPRIRDEALQGFEDLDRGTAVERANEVTDEEIPALIARRKILDLFFDALEARAYDLCAVGKLTGYKLVPGRSNRRWIDEEAALKLLKRRFGPARVTKVALISPAAVDDLIATEEAVAPVSTKFKNKVAALITKPEGKPTMAPVSDKRQALPLGVDEFAVIEEAPAQEAPVQEAPAQEPIDLSFME